MLHLFLHLQEDRYLKEVKKTRVEMALKLKRISPYQATSGTKSKGHYLLFKVTLLERELAS